MKRQTIPAVMVLMVLAGCGGELPLPPAPTATLTRTPTRTITPTPTTTPTLAPGANIGFIGILRQDNSLPEVDEFDALGRPIYTRDTASGFVIVIDAKPGTSGADVGTSTFDSDPSDPTVRPDLQIQVDRDLGDGSSAICDNQSGNFGGVPKVDPPSFAETQPISDALNDFGCRFVDGTGMRKGVPPNESCVKPPDGVERPVDPETTVEFCGRISLPLHFPSGDTMVTARVRDVNGFIGPERQIVIRVGAGS